MQIEYEGQLELDDWLKGNALAAKRIPWSSPVKFVPLIGGLALGGAMVFATPRVFGLLLLFWATMVANIFMARARTRRRYAELKSLQARFHTRVDDEGFRTTSPMFDDRRAWSDFVGWTEDAQYILLYEADVIVRIVPKRLLDDASRYQFRHLLSSHLGTPR